MKIHAEMFEILSEDIIQFEIPSQKFNTIHSLLVKQCNAVALSVIEIQNTLCYFLKSHFLAPHMLVQQYQVLFLLGTYNEKGNNAVVVIKFLAFGARGPGFCAKMQ